MYPRVIGYQVIVILQGFTVYTTVIVYKVYIILEVLYSVHNSHSVHSVHYITAVVRCTQELQGTQCTLYYRNFAVTKQSQCAQCIFQCICCTVYTYIRAVVLSQCTQGSLYHSCCTVYTAVIEKKCKLYYRCCNVYITAIGYTVFTISQLSNEYILFQYMYGVYNSHKKLYSVHYITVVGQYIKQSQGTKCKIYYSWCTQQ